MNTLSYTLVTAFWTEDPTITMRLRHERQKVSHVFSTRVRIVSNVLAVKNNFAT